MSTFDTHAAVTALRNAGIEEPQQAEAIVNTVRDAAGADRSKLSWSAHWQPPRSMKVG